MAKKEIISVPESEQITPRTVDSFLNNELKEHAKYVIETRALPSIMDGMRVGARKIMYASMIGDLKTKSLVKMPSLIGDTFKLHYNHGDASLMTTVCQLSSKHVYKFNPLEVQGQIGTLRVPETKTAVRYLHIRKTKFSKMFEIDKELWEYKIEDGDKVEPKSFLPILPIQLMFRTNCPGFGFSFRSFSYSHESVINNVIHSILNDSCQDKTYPLIPTIEGIKQSNIIYNSNKDSWYNVGEYEILTEKDIVIIKDLPFNIGYSRYEKHLNELIEKNYIVSFNNLSLKGSIRYEIKFSKGSVSKLMKESIWGFFQKLKLFSKIPKDTLNCIDSDNDSKILFYNDGYHLIDDFVKRRLKYYEARKTRTIKIINENIVDCKNRIKFINLILNDELILNKRSIQQIHADLDKFNLPHDLLKLSFYKLTEDEISKTNQELDELESELNYITTTTIQEMYIKDVFELYKTLNS